MNPQETVLAVAAFVAAITVIGHFTRKIYLVAKRIEGAIGVDESGRTISQRLDRVEHQLFPNGGSSLTDKINRMENEQRTLQGKIEAMERILASILRRLSKGDE